MSAPIDQRIVDEIARLLGAITVANGYETDAGLHVLTEESRDDLPDDAISIDVLDEVERIEQQARQLRKGQLQITLDIRVPNGPNARALCRLVMADVRRALAVEARQLPAGFTGLEVGDRALPPRIDGSQFLTPSMTLTAAYTETYSVPRPSNQ